MLSVVGAAGGESPVLMATSRVPITVGLTFKLSLLPPCRLTEAGTTVTPLLVAKVAPLLTTSAVLEGSAPESAAARVPALTSVAPW